MPLTIGLKGRAETVVTAENTAAAAGSGLLPVFATPMMIALMENAAVDATSAALSEGELIAVDGRGLTFHVAAYDASGPIGKGTHQRFIIQNEKFMAKAERKKETN